MEVADLPARIEARRRLEKALGVDRGLFADLQSGVVILAPLLACAAAVFLSGYRNWPASTAATAAAGHTWAPCATGC